MESNLYSWQKPVLGSDLFLSSLNFLHSLIVVIIVLLSSVFVSSFRHYLWKNIFIRLMDLRRDKLSLSFILFVF